MLGGDWLTNNWKPLSTMARRKHPTEWRELMTHFCFYLDKNWPQFSLMVENDRMKFSNVWMSNNIKWPKSDFNKSIRVNNLPEEDYPIEDLEEQYLEIIAEDIDDATKEWMIDISKNYSSLNQFRIFKVRQIYLELPTHQKVLYNLYFTDMMSLRQIGAKLCLPTSAVHTMLNELKKILKDNVK